ncbi:MAG TPA: PQQ-binding-like beta-propeller repeat protein [Aliidongia sp.]|nr:PQQ-binding-like beta-propeller repeat protein [Aliidongia sp.]
MGRIVVRWALAAILCSTFIVWQRQATAQAVDWSTHGFDLLRTGYNPRELTLNPSTAAGLHLLWSADMGDAVNAQPLSIHDVLINGVPTEILFVAATNGVIAAFNAATGQQIWRDQEQVQNLGTACQFYPNGIFGIADTPVYDRQDNALLFVDGAGLMYEIDAATGQNKPGWPIQILANPELEYVRGGLNLFNRIAYVTVSSYCDRGAYNGAAMAVNIDTRQVVASFVPASLGNGGGIWGYGGVAIDTSTDAIYLATGNSLSGEHQGLAESVVRLDLGLNVVASNYPGLVGNDVDFGTVPLLYTTACGPQLAAMNKDGALITFAANSIGSGPLQKIQVSSTALIGMAALDPTSGLIFVENAGDSPDGTFQHGLVAFSPNGQCQLEPVWQAVQGPNFSGKVGPPSTVSGVAVYGDGGGNTLHAFDKSGTELWNSGSTIQGRIVSAPAIANGKLFSGAYDGHIYVFGVAPSPLVSAILPGARSVEAGTPATVFATMVNSGTTALGNCRPSLPLSAPAGLAFGYQTVDPATNQTVGQPNQAAAIGAGGAQSFVLSFQSVSALAAPGQQVTFACDGVTPAPSFPEIGAVDLSFSASSIADVVALVATGSGDGILTVPFSRNAPGAFAAASVNVGAADTLTVSVDTGTVPLPLAVSICETNPANAQCLAPPAQAIQVGFTPGSTPTFSVFVTATAAVPSSFGLSRIFVRFVDANGVAHGSTSVAVETD